MLLFKDVQQKHGRKWFSGDAGDPGEFGCQVGLKLFAAAKKQQDTRLS